MGAPVRMTDQWAGRLLLDSRAGSGYGTAYAFFPGFRYQESANWDTTDNEPSQGNALPYGWGKIQRDIIVAPAKIASTQKRITLNQEMTYDYG